MIVVMSAVTGAYTFLGSPVKGKSDDKILQIWLQARVPAAIVYAARHQAFIPLWRCQTSRYTPRLSGSPPPSLHHGVSRNDDRL